MERGKDERCRFLGCQNLLAGQTFTLLWLTGRAPEGGKQTISAPPKTGTVFLWIIPKAYWHRKWSDTYWYTVAQLPHDTATKVHLFLILIRALKSQPVKKTNGAEFRHPDIPCFEVGLTKV